MFNGNHHKLKRWFKSVFTAVAGVAVISAFHLWSLPDSINDDKEPVAGGSLQQQQSPFSVVSDQSKPVSAVAEQVLPVPLVAFPASVQALIDAGDFAGARALLLAAASDAVDSDNEKGLAEVLALIGELSLLEEDIDAADVYLTEALEVFLQIDEPMAAAGVYGQIGRLHLLARERARRAASAYDTLLISRWRISQGQFYEAEGDLRRAVESNIELKRYGAAASAYETLYRGYMEEGDHYQAQLAGVEAIRLHASSGRLFDAEALQQKMLSQGIAPIVFENLRAELALLNDEFEASVKAIGMARDQAQLYNQLKARGDIVTAWRFRQQSNASLANASTRVQYRRQPDVLAELYRSNSNIKNANDSLQKASELYKKFGVDTTQLQALRKLVY